MVAKKSARKKLQRKSKTTASKTILGTRSSAKSQKQTAKKKLAGKATAPKKLPGKKAARGKPASRTKAIGKKTTTTKTIRAPKKQLRKGTRDSEKVFPRQRMTAGSGLESGDLQGLSRLAGASSESVEELLEEGNAFEADAVKGVEDAGEAEEKEVHTHEVLEDDVPDEYLES